MLSRTLPFVTAVTTSIGCVGVFQRPAEAAFKTKPVKGVANRGENRGEPSIVQLGVPAMALAHMVDNSVAMGTSCKCSQSKVVMATALGAVALSAVYPSALQAMHHGEKMNESADNWYDQIKGIGLSSLFMLSRDTVGLTISTFILRAGQCIRPNGKICNRRFGTRLASLPILAVGQHAFIGGIERQMLDAGVEEKSRRAIGLAADLVTDLGIALIPIYGARALGKSAMRNPLVLGTLATSLSVEGYVRWGLENTH